MRLLLLLLVVVVLANDERIETLSDNALFASLAGDTETELAMLKELTDLVDDTHELALGSWKRLSRALLSKQTCNSNNKPQMTSFESILLYSDVDTVAAAADHSLSLFATELFTVAAKLDLDALDLHLNFVETLTLNVGDQIEPRRHVRDDFVAVRLDVVGERGGFRLHLTDPRRAACVVAHGQTPLFEAGTKFIDSVSDVLLFPGFVPFYSDVARRQADDAAPIRVSVLHLSRGNSEAEAPTTTTVPASFAQSVTRWPCPLVVRDIVEPLGADALAYVEADLRSDKRRRQKSNQGGDQSATMLLGGGALPASLLRARRIIEHAVVDMVTSSSSSSSFASLDIVASWWCSNGLLDWNSPHVHPDSDISGVFYLHVPEPAAKLCVLDPRPIGDDDDDDRRCIEPKSNRLVLFPSFIEHHVHPNLSSEQRVAIAFNVKVN
jgi:uncharacterized protein (TIGR02466 family)